LSLALSLPAPSAPPFPPLAVVAAKFFPLAIWLKFWSIPGRFKNRPGIRRIFKTGVLKISLSFGQTPY
jgi:hypothetical protein